MKKILILILLTSTLQSKAQSPIIDLSDRDGTRIIGAYYKDVNNVLDQFEGTWIFEEEFTILKIVLIKKTMSYHSGCYQDLLIGGCYYYKNGQTLINNLNQINTILPFEMNHSIAGNQLPTTPTPFYDYTADNFRVNLFFDEPSPTLGGEIEVRKTTVNGLEAIQILKRCSTLNNLPSALKDGFYTLIKE